MLSAWHVSLSSTFNSILPGMEEMENNQHRKYAASLFICGNSQLMVSSPAGYVIVDQEVVPCIAKMNHHGIK